MSRFIKTMEKDLSNAIKGISNQVLNSLVKKTPVDSGHMKNSWNLTENKINTSVGGSVREKISGKKDVYITNSVPYALAIEHGHSKQAPKGIVKLTVNELKSNS